MVFHVCVVGRWEAATVGVDVDERVLRDVKRQLDLGALFARVGFVRSYLRSASIVSAVMVLAPDDRFAVTRVFRRTEMHVDLSP